MTEVREQVSVASRQLEASLPRVLIYSHEFPQSGTAGGLILSRLLRDYPKEQVLILGPAPQPNSGPLEFPHRPIGMPWSKFEHSRFNRLHRSMRSFGLVPRAAVAKVASMVGDFRPEVVLTVMQHGTWYDSAWLYAQEAGLPLVAVIHDDNEEFDKVHAFASGAQRRRDGGFYRFARHRLCVSPEMEEEFAQRYGVRGEVMYPIRSEDLHPRDLRENRMLKVSGRLTLGFVGNPNYGYGEQLLRMVPAFREANVRLLVWGRQPGGPAAPLADAADVVELRGFLPSAKAWAQAKEACDAVILPYSDPPGRMEKLYSIHFPSKLPEYLALGMPVVVAGPASATGVRWAANNPGAALLLDGGAPETWAPRLAELRKDDAMRESLGHGALAAGNKYFQPAAIRTRFLELVRGAAASQKAGVLP